MPSTNLYCETWELYETTYKGVVEFDSNLKKEFADIKEVPKVIRVYGTKDEIKNLSKRYDIDESYDFKVERKGSYWYNLSKNPEEDNKKIRKKLLEYKELYKRKGGGALILRIQ
tara:strand:+ start:152 stop:493 length:342 start_codon:yes stop_codon:yes gene_type:complete